MSTVVDRLILGGFLISMNAQNEIIEDSGIAIQGTKIAAVGTREQIRAAYEAESIIDASKQVVMPGLVDTYGHAGHGLIRGFYHPVNMWPAGDLYWHHTTEEWWYAEARLAAAERLRFGVTTGASIIGSTPARTDSPIFAIRNAEAYAETGIRAVLGVGPPDPFVSHIPAPWSGSYLGADGTWERRQFSYADAMANSIEMIKQWHGGADGRIRIALAPAYLFGRHVFRKRFIYEYDIPRDVPVMLEKAAEMRDLASRFGVQIHTHMFQNSVNFALEHFGRDRVEDLLGPDVVIAHGNGLLEPEIEVVGGTHCHVASAPSTTENLWYGYAPVIDLLEAGANVTISTDGSAPRFSFDLWRDISRAMWHQWITYRSQHILPPGKALRMVTIDAARALGLADEIGSLEVGKKADIITVDLNRPHLTPTTFVPQLLTYYVNGNDVDTVLVDGQILLEKGQIQSVDLQDVLDAAQAEADKALARIDVTPYTEMTPDFWQAARY